VSRLLIDGCQVVVTMDDAGTEIAGGSILLEDGAIAWVGSSGAHPQAAEGADVLDGRGTVAIPGLVNTHHHLYQTLTRARAREQGLFGWLTELYPVWEGIDAALSGCTTTTDHHYVFPAGRPGLLEAEIDAAREIGLRFHPCRGSMDLGASDGGLPPDRIVQDTDAALADTEEAVRRHHDATPGSMLRVAVAPCSPFSATERLMKESGALARRLGVRLHTHIAETRDEEAFCAERFGRRPIELLEDLGFLGSDVWLAHAVHLSDDNVARLAATGTGVAHCPTSNLRLGSGIARTRELLDARVPVGLGVDGSASNDSGDLLSEVRQAMLVARAAGDPASLTAREALRIATRGGAECLGRAGDLGSLEAGKRADVALFGVDGLAFVGAGEDLVAALALCRPQSARHVIVEGRVVVRDGRLATADQDAIAAEGHRVARRIAGAER